MQRFDPEGSSSGKHTITKQTEQQNAHYQFIYSIYDLEVIAIKIGQNHNQLILCTVYIPPNPGDVYLNSLLSYLTHLVTTHEKIVITGDFNFPDINWSSLTGLCSSSNIFCDFIFNHNLTQLVENPTHNRGNVLDLVLTSNADDVYDLCVIRPNQSLPLSDHYMISFKIALSPSHMYAKIPKESHSCCYVFDFPKADIEGIICYLSDSDFSSCFQSNDVEFVWSSIKQLIFNAMHLFIPKVRLKSHQSPKWFTPQIRHHINCLRSMRRRYKSNPTTHLQDQINLAQCNLQEEINSAKSAYETSLIYQFADTNNSKIYKYINSITGQSSIPPTVTLGLCSASSNSEKASLFNSYFHSVFSQSSFEIPSLASLSTSVSTLSEVTISSSEVFEVLSALDTSKAMGVNGIGPLILKKCAHVLFEPIHHLFSLSLSHQSIPVEWRTHFITPIHKSGTRSLVNNYRPISLLCIISKVLERIIYNHITVFVTGSLSSIQFGFLKNRSTVKQLLIFLNSVHQSLNNKVQTDVIYLDFSKAFDSVPHNELLVKLWQIGIRGKLWLWFKSYLSSRRQCVHINNFRSSLLPVISGVPQGSILGPLLFLIYVNDLPLSINSSSLLLFADDTKCLKSIDCLHDCDLLQNDLSLLSDWSLKWKLLFNVSKCVNLTFSLSHDPIVHPYFINDKEILSKDCHKDLGVFIAGDLSWSVHYDHICSRAYKMLGLLRRVFCRANTIIAKKHLFNVLVKSQISYCSEIWRPHLLKDIQTLENIQRRATKFILSDFSSDYKSRLLSLNMLPLMMQFELSDIMFFIKSLKEPSDSFDILKYVTFCSGRTRSATFLKLKLPSVRTNLERHFYFNRLPRLWNSSPPISTVNSLYRIKSDLRKFLWSHFVTNFDPARPCSFHLVCPCSRCSHLPVTQF